MYFIVSLAMIVGLSTIVQGALNAKLIPVQGLTNALVWNNAFVLLLSLVLWGLARYFPQFFPQIFQAQTLRLPPLWILLPALSGMIIVAGIPWGFSLGSPASFALFFVVSQLVVSQLWDFAILGMPLHPMKVAGAIIAIAGVSISTLAK